MEKRVQAWGNNLICYTKHKSMSVVLFLRHVHGHALTCKHTPNQWTFSDRKQTKSSMFTSGCPCVAVVTIRQINLRDCSLKPTAQKGHSILWPFMYFTFRAKNGCLLHVGMVWHPLIKISLFIFFDFYTSVRRLSRWKILTLVSWDALSFIFTIPQVHLTHIL